MASSSAAFAKLPLPLQRAVIALMMQLRQSEQAQIVHCRAFLEALADAVALLSDEEEAADAVSLVFLPVYTILTLAFPPPPPPPPPPSPLPAS